MIKIIIIIQIIIIIIISLFNILINIFPSYNKKIHPIILGILLFFISIINSLNLRIYINNNWFSFIIFLIIIRRIIILFLYFIRFIRNIIISIKFNYIKIIPIKFILIIIFFFIIIKKYRNNFIWYNNFNEIIKINLLIKINFINEKIQYIYIYIYNKNIITLLSIIYLFLCLTIIVKICLNKKYSIRKINYEKINF